MDRALCAGTTRSSGQALRSAVTASFLPWIEEAAVLPFRIAAGELHIAGAELPVGEMEREMLNTQTQFEELAGMDLA